MAHYAKLGLDNIVTAVVVVDNINCMTPGGIESEEIGIAFLTKNHGHDLWRKCSYNTREGVYYDPETNEPAADQSKAFRANYAGTGMYYNSEHDIFHAARPVDKNQVSCASWTLNTTTGVWEPPITRPELTMEQRGNGLTYRWDEAAYQADNTEGWVLENW